MGQKPDKLDADDAAWQLAVTRETVIRPWRPRDEFRLQIWARPAGSSATIEPAFMNSCSNIVRPR